MKGKSKIILENEEFYIYFSSSKIPITRTFFIVSVQTHSKAYALDRTNTRFSPETTISKSSWTITYPIILPIIIYNNKKRG